MADDLVKQLREGALEKQQEAWDRADGGQDLSIEAGLALVAADRLESLEAALQAADELARAMQREEDCFGLPDFMQAALASYRKARGGEP